MKISPYLFPFLNVAWQEKKYVELSSLSCDLCIWFWVPIGYNPQPPSLCFFVSVFSGACHKEENHKISCTIHLVSHLQSLALWAGKIFSLVSTSWTGQYKYWLESGNEPDRVEIKTQNDKQHSLCPSLPPLREVCLKRDSSLSWEIPVHKEPWLSDLCCLHSARKPLS